MTNVLIIILASILVISISINILAVWYSVRLSRTTVYFSENMNDMLDMLTDFSNHVKSVYELETFYGDQVLHNLLKHGRDIVEQIESFEEILYLTEELEEEGENMYDEEYQIERETTDNRGQAEKAPDQTQFRFEV